MSEVKRLPPYEPLPALSKWLKGNPKEPAKALLEVVDKYRKRVADLSLNPEVDDHLLEYANEVLTQIEEVISGEWPEIDSLLQRVADSKVRPAQAASDIRGVVALCVGNTMLAMAGIADAGMGLAGPDLFAGRRLKNAEMAEEMVRRFRTLRDRYPDEYEHSDTKLCDLVAEEMTADGLSTSGRSVWKAVKERLKRPGGRGRKKRPRD